MIHFFPNYFFFRFIIYTIVSELQDVKLVRLVGRHNLVEQTKENLLHIWVGIIHDFGFSHVIYVKN